MTSDEMNIGDIVSHKLTNKLGEIIKIDTFKGEKVYLIDFLDEEHWISHNLEVVIKR